MPTRRCAKHRSERRQNGSAARAPAKSRFRARASTRAPHDAKRGKAPVRSRSQPAGRSAGGARCNEGQRRSDSCSMPTEKHQKRGNHRQAGKKAPGASKLVVCLADALADEVFERGGTPGDEDVAGDDLAAAPSANRTHQLVVFEEHVGAVSSRKRGPAEGQRAGPVTVERSIDQRTCGIPERMPRRRRKEVLRPHDVGVFESAQNVVQRGGVVTDVIVGNDDVFVRGQWKCGQHATHFAVAPRHCRPYVQRKLADEPVQPVEKLLPRRVDDNDFEPLERSEVARQLRDGDGGIEPKRQDVRRFYEHRRPRAKRKDMLAS